MLSRDDIRRALLALAGELEGLPVRCEIVVVGGAAVVLLYGAREATKDVDVFILRQGDPSLVRGAVQRVADALELPDDWLNDAAKGYVHGLSLGDVLIDEPALLVRALAPHQLLAMKLSAWRDDVDIEDAPPARPALRQSRRGLEPGRATHRPRARDEGVLCILRSLGVRA